MAATGKTPILLYGSTTATNQPSAGNLTNSSDGCEIAINVADKNLFFKDATDTVNTVPIRQSSASSNGWLSSTDWTTFNNKGSGSVTSVSGTGTVNGLTLTGTVTNSGSLTLGGTLSGIANSALTNSSITFGSTAVSLGGTVSALNGVSIGQSTPAAGTFSAFSVTGVGLFGLTASAGLGAKIQGKSGAGGTALETFDSAGNQLCAFRDNGYAYIPPAYNKTTASAANVFVGSSGDLYRSTSSLKYKTNVQDATHGLVEVLKLRPVTYQGTSENDGNKVFGGLIAEEVDAIGLKEFVQYADDGTPDALAYGNMVALLTKAIQEQQAQIKELQDKITSLGAK